jgi:hypothetical protein
MMLAMAISCPEGNPSLPDAARRGRPPPHDRPAFATCWFGGTREQQGIAHAYWLAGKEGAGIA